MFLITADAAFLLLRLFCRLFSSCQTSHWWKTKARRSRFCADQEKKRVTRTTAAPLQTKTTLRVTPRGNANDRTRRKQTNKQKQPFVRFPARDSALRSSTRRQRGVGAAVELRHKGQRTSPFNGAHTHTEAMSRYTLATRHAH